MKNKEGRIKTAYERATEERDFLIKTKELSRKQANAEVQQKYNIKLV